MDDFSTEVWLWWGMAAIGLLSLVLWAVSAWSVLRRSEPAQAILRYRRWQLLLSAGCVLGCASGSFVLWADVQRLSSIDGLSANVLVGRTIATVAEVMFVAQWALLLGFLSRRAGSGSGLHQTAAVALAASLAGGQRRGHVGSGSWASTSKGWARRGSPLATL